MVSQSAIIVLVCLVIAPALHGLEDCPYRLAKPIIIKFAHKFDTASEQMLAIRTYIEKDTKADWGVFIVQEPNSVSEEVHWTVPSVRGINGVKAFCITTVNGWLYNVFMTFDKERRTRARRHMTSIRDISMSENIEMNASNK